MLFPQLLLALLLAASVLASEICVGELLPVEAGRPAEHLVEPAAAVAVMTGRWSACVMSRG